MEYYTLKNDLEVFYVKAHAFPEGIAEAHERMHALLPSLKGRKRFGISHPDRSGRIIYMAGVEAQHPNEGKEFNCETFILKKGKYLSQLLTNYRGQVSSIGETFEKMIADPAVDPEGACVEEYLNDHEMRCMVRLA